jgi:hypothetical protein
VTGNLIQLKIPGMGTPGRRPSTSSEWKLAFIRRVIEARESTKMEPAEFAAALQRASGRNISYDTYRKYEIEDAKKGALLRHDLMLAFCELTRTHVAYLLEGDGPFQQRAPVRTENRRRVA